MVEGACVADARANLFAGCTELPALLFYFFAMGASPCPPLRLRILFFRVFLIYVLRRPQMYDTSKRVRVKSRRLAVLYYFISLAGAPFITSPSLIRWEELGTHDGAFLSSEHPLARQCWPTQESTRSGSMCEPHPVLELMPPPSSPSLRACAAVVPSHEPSRGGGNRKDLRLRMVI